MFFFFNDTAPTEIYTLSLHDALPISALAGPAAPRRGHHHHAVRAHGLPVAGTELREDRARALNGDGARAAEGSEEHTSELQSRLHLVCRLLLEKKKSTRDIHTNYTTF